MRVSIQRIGKMMQSYFKGFEVTQVAYRTEFVRRSSRLSGLIFLRALVFACLEHPRVTLNQVAQACYDLGVEISPQGIDERIGPQSVAFMKGMFEQAMGLFINHLPLPLPILDQFRALNLLDSSIISLPEGLAQMYPGSGGNASGASLKLQLVFDFRFGNLKQLLLGPGREPDQGFGAYLEMVLPGSLTLMDLGYFNLGHFKAIADRLAYFLSRFKADTGLLTLAGEEIDVLQLLQTACHTVLDQPVRLGKGAKHRLPCRLIAFRLPQEVADQRRRKAKANAKRRGQTITKRRLALLDWAILVTNVPAVMLSAQQLALLYRVRWQIELIFKLWKSYCGLREFGQLRHDRILTELYARMIGIVLTHFLAAPFRMPAGVWANREISPVQVRQIFQRFARSLCQVLDQLTLLTRELADMIAHLNRFGFKQKRIKQPNICHALALASSVHYFHFTPQHQVEALALCP